MSLGYTCFCILSWMFNWKATGSIWILLPLLLQNTEIEPGKANTRRAANWHCFSVLDLLKVFMTLTLHNTFSNSTRKGKAPANTMPGSSEKVPCTDSGFECNLGREYCFTFIPTQSFLHQPYMIYSIFIANISMKPHFVQTEAMKKEWSGLAMEGGEVWVAKFYPSHKWEKHNSRLALHTLLFTGVGTPGRQGHGWRMECGHARNEMNSINCSIPFLSLCKYRVREAG